MALEASPFLFNEPVLLVDDEPLVRELVKDIITGENLVSEQNVLQASNGKEGLKAIEEFHPIIVVTDIRMPEMDGVSMVKTIHEMGIEVSIIALTAYADFETAVPLFTAGTSEILRKPFQPEELIFAFKKCEESLRLKQEKAKMQRLLVESEKLSSVGLLAAGIAHEINNPATFVKGGVELLKTYWNLITPILEEHREDKLKNGMNLSDLQTEFEQSTKDILDGVKRIQDIVKGLLAHSRSPQGNKNQRVDVNRCIQDAMGLVRFRLQSVTVKTELPEETFWIQGDPQDLVHALMNVLVNAVDALESQDASGVREILIQCVRDDQGYVLVSVVDTGPGMSEEQLKHAFEPFFTTKDVGRGTGLGLYIVRGNIERSGGEIEIKSHLGQGTSFIFRFPPEGEK